MNNLIHVGHIELDVGSKILTSFVPYNIRPYEEGFDLEVS